MGECLLDQKWKHSYEPTRTCHPRQDLKLGTVTPIKKQKKHMITRLDYTDSKILDIRLAVY